MKSALVVAEKPSVAMALASVLGSKERKEGYLHGNGYLVSWAIGHLVELAQADAYDVKYSKWRYEDLPIIPQDWKYAVSKDKQKQLNILRELMNLPDVDTVICATDAGREGELIFRLVYEHCKCKKPVKRLWISSLEEAAIREGFAKLRPGSNYDSLYRSALCRAQADWLVGINATRAFSCLYGATLNVGRVQTPTLALLVDREKAVNAFKPEVFFVPEIDCGGFVATGERVFDAQIVQDIRTACEAHDAVCLSVEKQKKTIAPPLLYDLTTLQREANRLFGYTAQETLDYIQSLYEKKLSSYPRSDSRFLTEDMVAGLPALVEATAGTLPFTFDVKLNTNVQRVVDNSKVSDHHAIIPTRTMAQTDLSALPAGERHILQMLSVRLICATSDAHSFEAVTAVLECNGHRFTARGKTVLHEGWKTVDNAFRAMLRAKAAVKPVKRSGKGVDESLEMEDGEENVVLPYIGEGEIFPAIKSSVREGKTSSPRRYTEDTLLAAMEAAGVEDMPEDVERKGLGTTATRAGIIEKLIKTGFVERKKRLLVPTQKGINLIAILPENVKSPLLTAEWEQKLKLVESGELNPDEFIEGIFVMMRELVKNQAAPNAQFMPLFAASPDKSKGVTSREIVGICPRCGSDITEMPKSFACSNQACTFVLWRENRFFASKRKNITKAVATTLLKNGRVFIADLYSEHKEKTYGATVVLDDTGGYVNFKLEFEEKRKP